jgi:hypothetical protein
MWLTRARLADFYDTSHGNILGRCREECKQTLV